MRRFFLAAVLLASVGCAGLVPPVLTGSDTSANVKQLSARAADAIQTALVVLDQAGEIVNVSPLSVAQKDALDCGILKVTGHDAPSATVLKVCGPIPSNASSVLGRSLAALRHVGTDGTLKSILIELLSAVNALIDKLVESGYAPLSGSASVLRMTFGFAATYLGGS